MTKAETAKVIAVLERVRELIGAEIERLAAPEIMADRIADRLGPLKAAGFADYLEDALQK